MIEQLAARVFATRNAAHAAHWATRSYAEHMALGDFYDAVIDAVDAVVEAYQGQNDLITVPPVAPVSGPMLRVLADDLAWINANRDAIAGGNESLGNLVDGVANVYQSALYKLRFLN